MAPVAIEGVIGSGKSTILERLAALGFSVAPEPVEAWTPFLERTYSQGTGHVAAQCRIMLDTCVACPAQDIVERCPLLQPDTFIPAMRIQGAITVAEEAMLRELNKRLLTWRPRGIVFLRCSLDEVKRRVRRRARSCERDIDDSYLDTLHSLYEYETDMYALVRPLNFPDAVDIETTGRPLDDVVAEVVRALRSMGCTAAGG